MSKEYNEEIFGPKINWREFSFMDNPRSNALKDSILTVKACSGQMMKHPECADGRAPAISRGDVVHVRRGLNDMQIREALFEVASNYKVIHFVGPAKIWGGFESKEKADMFKRRLDMYGSIWCCVDANPGHIWYDFFWDDKKHVDRHNRVIEGTWRPMTGP